MVVAKSNADLKITLVYGGSRRMTDGALGNIGVGGTKASLVRRTFGEHDGCTSGDSVD